MRGVAAAVEQPKVADGASKHGEQHEADDEDPENGEHVSPLVTKGGSKGQLYPSHGNQQLSPHYLSCWPLTAMVADILNN